MTYEKTHACDLCGKESDFANHDVRRLSVSSLPSPESDVSSDLASLDYCEDHSKRSVAMALAMSLVNTSGIIPERWQSDDSEADDPPSNT